MKLRTTHNSIRIRIKKSELTTLQQKNIIKESIRFPNGVLFRFALKICNTIETVGASLEDDFLVLSIPENIATNWINTNEVGIERSIKLSDEEQLHLLIEKISPV